MKGKYIGKYIENNQGEDDEDDDDEEELDDGDEGAGNPGPSNSRYKRVCRTHASIYSSICMYLMHVFACVFALYSQRSVLAKKAAAAKAKDAAPPPAQPGRAGSKRALKPSAKAQQAVQPSKKTKKAK